MRSAKTRRRSTRCASPPPPASIEWRPMVDLVKIRKKAKKAAETVAEPVASSQLPVAEEPVVAEPATGNRQPATEEQPATAATTDKLAKFKEEAGHRREGLIVETRQTAADDVTELLTFVIAG